MHAQHPLPTAGRLHRSARLYLLHVALLTASLSIFGLFFNLTVLSLGFTIDFLGVLNSVAFAVSALLSLPLLWLLTHLRLRQALLGSGLLQLAGMLLFALWPATWPLLLAGGLAGAGAVLFEISAAPFMMQQSDATTRDRLFSTSAALRIGMAGVGSLVGGQLPALLSGWLRLEAHSPLAYRATLLVAAGGVLLALLPLLLIGATQPAAGQDRPRSPGTPRLAAPPGWHELLAQPGPLLRLLISPALISIGAALLIPYLNLFFTQRFAVPDQLLGAIFAGLGICTGLAGLAAPVLARRLGSMHTIVLTEALAIPFLVLLGLAPQLGLAVGAALARAALFNMGSPLYDAIAMQRAPAAARPTVSALMSGAYSVGYLLGPLISTQVQARYGFGPLFVATTGCYLAAVLAKYWFFVRNQAPQDASGS
ncbi:MAG: MFS transporter [Kouleothrix sp.]|jgi:predicted MFS family arabinose efflux permease|nr:MFS transporter [Kouleothrix sp.]